MIVHQVFAMILNETVMNIMICENYQLANDIAKGSYGPEAFAVDILQYPCQMGDKYINGRFYRQSDGTEIEYVPTQEQEVAKLKAENALLATALSFSAVTFSDEQAIQVSEIYPVWSGEGVSYQVGDRIREGIGLGLYKCITAHISQPDWKPSVSPSLFAEVLIEVPGVIAEWVQPNSTNPYMKGDKVSHNGKEWESIVDNNVWEPGVVGNENLWKEIV